MLLDTPRCNLLWLDFTLVHIGVNTHTHTIHTLMIPKSWLANRSILLFFSKIAFGLGCCNKAVWHTEATMPCKSYCLCMFVLHHEVMGCNSSRLLVQCLCDQLSKPLPKKFFFSFNDLKYSMYRNTHRGVMTEHVNVYVLGKRST